jgi:hypothetical protein
MRSLEAILRLCWFYPRLFSGCSCQESYIQPLKHPMKICLVILQLYARSEISKSYFFEGSTRLEEPAPLDFLDAR